MVNERNAVMKNVAKIIAGAVLAFVCGGIVGCTDVDFHWEEGRSAASVVGFVDDSLVMVGDVRCWSEVTDGLVEYLEESGCGQERLCVYNYRVQEKGPRWCDSLPGKKMTGIFGATELLETHAGQMTDSVIWGIFSENSIALWKIGESLHEIKLLKSLENCSTEFDVSSIHEWLGGKFFARGDKSLNAGGGNCQYAVLDTNKKTITYKRLEDGLKWIEKCDDVRAWGEDVYCVVLDEETYDAYLMMNDVIVSNMEKSEYKLGNYANVSFMGPFLKLHQTVYKYQGSEVERMTSFSSQGISFGDGKGNYITY